MSVRVNQLQQSQQTVYQFAPNTREGRLERYRTVVADAGFRLPNASDRPEYNTEFWKGFNSRDIWSRLQQDIRKIKNPPPAPQPGRFVVLPGITAEEIAMVSHGRGAIGGYPRPEIQNQVPDEFYWSESD
jgi:hypothetical protein